MMMEDEKKERRGMKENYKESKEIRKGQPTPMFLPGISHGQKSLLDYSPWGHRRVGHNLATKQQWGRKRRWRKKKRKRKKGNSQILVKDKVSSLCVSLLKTWQPVSDSARQKKCMKVTQNVKNKIKWKRRNLPYQMSKHTKKLQ